MNIDAAERSEGRLLFRNVGVLFFAHEPRRFFNQAYITCLLFKGTARVDILDRKDFSGGIAGDIEESLRFIERNTRTAYRIEKLQRENIPEYPVKALREAITNAVMHRDWFIEGANVFVEIHADHIEVVSPGGLPTGMLPEDLGHKSIRRNPLIADLLHRIEFIEKAGTGIKRMRDEARDRGCPDPVYETTNFFTAHFYPNPAVRDQVIQEMGEQVPGKVTPKAVAHDEAYEPMTEIELKLLAACAQDPKSTPDLLKILGYKSRTGNYKKALSRLLSRGFLDMTNPEKPRAKNQRYRIASRGREMLNKYHTMDADVK